MKNVFAALMILAGIMVTAGLAAQATSVKTTNVSKTSLNLKQTSGQQAGPNFIDTDGDGICDNRSKKRGGNKNFVDANNDGVCDNFAARGTNRQGKNFIDNNNDGVCDNLANSRQGRGHGKGKGRCGGNGQGNKNRCGQQPSK